MGAVYHLYAHNGLESSACGYYRIVLPLTTMEKMGLPVETILDNGAAYVSNTLRGSMFMESDITLLYQNTGGVSNEYMKFTAGCKPGRIEGGGLQYPPTYIADTDDDLFNVMPLNETYSSLGTRRPDGTPLNPGDEVGIAHPLEFASTEQESILADKCPGPMPGMRENIGEERFIYGGDSRWHKFFSLWRDGGPMKNFDITNNQSRIENWRGVLRASQLVTCSTPRAADYVKREVPEANTFVTPNAIDFDEYPEIELREHPGKVRILWEGSACHHEGLWPLNASLVKIAEKYPEVEWVFWGAPYKWAVKNMPKDRITLLPWVLYDAYKIRLATIGHDINLAPLAPNTFNDSRSAIRWYESSAIWRPAATIAQRWAAFRDEMVEGETGLLFDTPQEFEDKLSALIEDEKLRKTLAANAKDWVRTNREAKKIALKLFNKYVEVRENHKLSMPPPESEPESAVDPV